MVLFFEFSNRLEEDCISNQDEFEALLFELGFLQSMSVKLKHVEAFGDSFLVVHQVFNANALTPQASSYAIVMTYCPFESQCRQKSSCRFWRTSLTSHKTGLTAQTTGDTNSAMKDDSITKAEDQDLRVPIISYLMILVALQRGIFGVWHSKMF